MLWHYAIWRQPSFQGRLDPGWTNGNWGQITNPPQKERHQVDWGVFPGYLLCGKENQGPTGQSQWALTRLDTHSTCVRFMQTFVCAFLILLFFFSPFSLAESVTSLGASCVECALGVYSMGSTRITRRRRLGALTCRSCSLSVPVKENCSRLLSKLVDCYGGGKEPWASLSVVVWLV